MFFFCLSLMSISICMPCFLISFFYIKIFVYACLAKSRTMSANRILELKHAVKISKGLFGSYILFTICWLPYALVIMIDFDDKFSINLYVWTMFLAICNSTMNPIFYALTNPKFQLGYKNVFNLILFRTVQSTNEQTSIRLTRF